MQSLRELAEGWHKASKSDCSPQERALLVACAWQLTQVLNHLEAKWKAASEQARATTSPHQNTKDFCTGVAAGFMDCVFDLKGE